MDLLELTIEQARKKLIQKEISASQLAAAYLKQIASLDKEIKAYLEVDEESLIKEAKKADQLIAQGKSSAPLLGIPLAFKDNILVAGKRATAASKILESYTAAYDSTVAKKLKAAGALYLGRTNCDEFTMGSSCENSAYGPTANPWDFKKVPGGSSGGSAAAVAADMCPAALGSDTGGSIRQPASFCGVVGLKPTYGRVSRSGLIAFASSLDQIGPVTKSVEDAAILLAVIAGADPKDSTCQAEPVKDYAQECKKDIRGLIAGIPKEFFAEGLDSEVKKVIETAISEIKKLGVKIKEVSLPLAKYALPIYYIIQPAEASANLARYDGIRYAGLAQAQSTVDLESYYQEVREKGFGDEVKRRIIIGTFVLSSGYIDAYYKRAQQVRRLIQREYDDIFAKVDVLLTPTSPTVAFNLEEKVDDPLQMYLADIYTVSANISGIPGLSIPCGFAHEMPVGLQILGQKFSEDKILRLGYHYEQASQWYKKKPTNTNFGALFNA